MIKKQTHQMREKEYWAHLEKEDIELELKYVRDLPDNPPEYILKTLTEFEVDVTKNFSDGCSGLILGARCGNGNILMCALKLFPDVKIDYVGLDFVKNVLKRAVARAKENSKLYVYFFQGSVTDLPFMCLFGQEFL